MSSKNTNLDYPYINRSSNGSYSMAFFGQMQMKKTDQSIILDSKTLAPPMKKGEVDRFLAKYQDTPQLTTKWSTLVTHGCFDFDWKAKGLPYAHGEHTTIDFRRTRPLNLSTPITLTGISTPGDQYFVSYAKFRGVFQQEPYPIIEVYAELSSYSNPIASVASETPETSYSATSSQHTRKRGLNVTDLLT